MEAILMQLVRSNCVSCVNSFLLFIFLFHAYSKHCWMLFDSRNKCCMRKSQSKLVFSLLSSPKIFEHRKSSFTPQKKRCLEIPAWNVSKMYQIAVAKHAVNGVQRSMMSFDISKWRNQSSFIDGIDTTIEHTVNQQLLLFNSMNGEHPRN